MEEKNKKQNKAISVVMICKNESALIERALKSVEGCDELIICDTGSTDNTVEIAKKYTDKVCTEYKWNANFAEARNHAKSHATGDWILSLDSDEYLHDFSEVRRVVELAKDCVGVILRGEHGKADFRFPRLFRNTPDIQWFGAAHNHLGVTKEGEDKGINVSGEGELVGNVTITYGFSPAHALDPDRTLNILLNEVKDPTKVREMYYLGREYWYKGNYKEAAKWFGKHVQSTNFTAEKADSFLTMSKCYSALGSDDDARDACLQAINLNPNFKEAIRWMGHISYPQNAKRWYDWAESANNTNVLFIRE
jgi:glycosyltransferase involved in cell wall biosynthesis